MTRDPRYSNDPAVQAELIRSAVSGRQLLALQRPGDLRRDRLIGRLAPAAAMDDAFFAAANHFSGSLRMGLLDNPALPDLPAGRLAGYALTLIHCWDATDEPTSYIHALCDRAPAVADELSERIQNQFHAKAWQRNNRVGARSIEVLFTILDNIDPRRVQWLTSASGSQGLAQIASLFHPQATEEHLARVGGVRDTILMETEARYQPAIRERMYSSVEPRAVLSLVSDETDETFLAAGLKRLATNVQLLAVALEARLSRGLPMPDALLADLLTHDDRRIRELAILQQREPNTAAPARAR